MRIASLFLLQASCCLIVTGIGMGTVVAANPKGSGVVTTRNSFQRVIPKASNCILKTTSKANPSTEENQQKLKIFRSAKDKGLLSKNVDLNDFSAAHSAALNDFMKSQGLSGNFYLAKREPTKANLKSLAEEKGPTVIFLHIEEEPKTYLVTGTSNGKIHLMNKEGDTHQISFDKIIHEKKWDGRAYLNLDNFSDLSDEHIWRPTKKELAILKAGKELAGTKAGNDKNANRATARPQAKDLETNNSDNSSLPITILRTKNPTTPSATLPPVLNLTPSTTSGSETDRILKAYKQSLSPPSSLSNNSLPIQPLQLTDLSSKPSSPLTTDSFNMPWETQDLSSEIIAQRIKSGQNFGQQGNPFNPYAAQTTQISTALEKQESARQGNTHVEQGSVPNCAYVAGQFLFRTYGKEIPNWELPTQPAYGPELPTYFNALAVKYNIPAKFTWRTLPMGAESMKMKENMLTELLSYGPFTAAMKMSYPTPNGHAVFVGGAVNYNGKTYLKIADPNGDIKYVEPQLFLSLWAGTMYDYTKITNPNSSLKPTPQELHMENYQRTILPPTTPSYSPNSPTSYYSYSYPTTNSMYTPVIAY